MRTRPNEIDPTLSHLAYQQKISADMAFAVVRPFPVECMVEPFGAKRRIVGYQQQHGFFQPCVVITARV